MKNYSALLLVCAVITTILSSCEKEPLPEDNFKANTQKVITMDDSGEEDVPIDDKKD